MKINEAKKVLELHNKWRRGADIPMETPTRIGLAIEVVLAEIDRLKKLKSTKNTDTKDIKK